MGWRDRTDHLRAAAMTGAEQLRTNEKLGALKAATAAGADRVKNSDALTGLDTTRLKEAAVTASGVGNRRGDVKRWRLARAAITPAATATKVAKGLGAEITRQKRTRPGLDDSQDVLSVKGPRPTSERAPDETTPRGYV